VEGFRSDGTVKLWDLARRRAQATLRADSGEVRCVAFAPDGKSVAAGTRYSLVRVWDVGGERKATLKGHAGDVWAAVFLPDGRTLATGGGDWNRPGEVRLWDTSSWSLRATLPHSGEVLCVAAAPDGKALAAGSWDRTVRLWQGTALRGREE
jgi:WD40 repeat protein